MLKRILGFVAGLLAIVIFLTEYCVVAWPCLYLIVLWQHLTTRSNNLRLALKRGAEGWTNFWGWHIWGWVRRLLWLDVRLDMAPEIRQRISRPVIFIGNHTNSIDAVVFLWIVRELGLHVTWIVKEEFRRVPGVGWALQMLECAFVVRKRDPLDKVRVRECAHRAAQDGFSVGILPQGHRQGGSAPVNAARSGGIKFGGFDEICKELPGAQVLFVKVVYSSTRTKTILDAGALFGVRVTIEVRLYDDLTSLPEAERHQRLAELFASA